MRRAKATEPTTPTVTYHDVAITYDERDNVWRFTLRNVDRKATSLANAKVAIDKPEPKDKRRFEECFAYYKRSYSSEMPEKVRVTGIAERTGWSTRNEVWVVGVAEKSTRRKVDVNDLIAASPKNVKIIAEWEELEKQVDKLNEKQRVLVSRYEKFKLPDNIEKGEEEE